MTDVTPELLEIIEALEEAYTKDELVGFADEFGVELKNSWNKRNVATAYASDGITAELIKGLTPDPVEEEDDEPAAPVVEEVAPVAEPADDLVLVKMVRPNHSYEVRGYKFTRTHPFGLVTEDDADFLIEHDGGFTMASPKEARAYYS